MVDRFPSAGGGGGGDGGIPSHSGASQLEVEDTQSSTRHDGVQRKTDDFAPLRRLPAVGACPPLYPAAVSTAAAKESAETAAEAAESSSRQPRPFGLEPAPARSQEASVMHGHLQVEPTGRSAVGL